jgi:purine catabolism regulator
MLDNVRYKDRKAARQFENLQKDLLLAYLQGKTLDDAASFVAATIGTEVHIVDPDCCVLASSIASRVDSARQPGGVCLIGVGGNSQPSAESRIQKRGYDDQALRVELSAKSHLYGYLVAADWSTCESNYDAGLFEQFIVPSVTLWFDKEQLINDTKLTLINDFVWSLAVGDWSCWDTMLYRARLFGFDLELPYVCIVGRPNPDAGFKVEHNGGWPGWIQNNSDMLLKVILFAAKTGNKKVMVTFREDMMVMFLDISPDCAEAYVHRFLDKIDEGLKSDFPKIRYSWGISEISNKKTDYRKCFNNAKLALDICYNEKWPFRRNTYRDTDLYKVLRALSDNADIARVVKGVLGKLVQYDGEKGLGLIETYLAYIQQSCNASRTAKAIHLHRQSLIYRLNKIMELTDCDTNNAEHKFLLELCIRLHMSFRFPHDAEV